VRNGGYHQRLCRAVTLAVIATTSAAASPPEADRLKPLRKDLAVRGGFGGRANAAKLAAASGGGADTEQAVDRALKWIALHQMPDGGWSFDFKQCPSCQGRCSHGGDEGRGKDRCGGWRYSPKQAGDTSAVGWQLMALKSGNMAYLQVNPLTITKATQFLDSVQQRGGAAYGYDKRGDRPGTNAVGLLCRMYLGWKKDHPALQEGVLALAKRGPTNDMYSTYYATQIMHHMEGDVWQAWNERMKKLLLPTQSKKAHEAGSWHEGVNGGHGAHVAGRLYCTALATMTLEAYYRHLPLY
jgi:hypothetical protein